MAGVQRRHTAGRRCPPEGRQYRLWRRSASATRAARSKPTDCGVDKQFHHSFVDPSKAKGTEAEVMDVIRTARDEIETEMTRLLRDHS